MAQPKLLFITGVGRSGTSLLQSILSAHPEINIPPETHFFKRYVLPFIWNGKPPKYSHLQSDRYLKRLPKLTLEKLYVSLAGEGRDLSSAFTNFLTGEGKPAVAGDKDTEYVRYLPHLKKVYPDAFLLHIKRDPRDVLASRKKAEWSKNRSVEFHAAEYQYYIKKVESEGPKFFEDRYFSIRYEDLLLEPKQTLQPVLKGLGLDFSEEMLQFHKSSENLVANDEKAWKQNLEKPIMKSNFNKWKKELSKREIGLIQRGLESFFKKNQYDLAPAKTALKSLILREAYKWLFRAKTLKERIN